MLSARGFKALVSGRGSSSGGEACGSTGGEPQRPERTWSYRPDGSFVCAEGVATADDLGLARENFRRFDVDGDGLISRADFQHAMARHDQSWARPERREQLDAMYRAVDLDGSERARAARAHLRLAHLRLALRRSR